jgi:hypothetical protein
MELTQLDIDRMIGGQAQYQSLARGTLYCGEIGAIEMAGHALIIEFNWFAEIEQNSEWHVFNEKSSEIDMSIYSATYAEYGRILLSSWEDPEVITLFPPRHTLSGIAQQGMLDPNKVRGLVLA